MSARIPQLRQFLACFVIALVFAMLPAFTAGHVAQAAATALKAAAHHTSAAKKAASANASGLFQPPIASPAGLRPFSPAIGDFNGDGHLDVAVPNYELNGTVSVLLGNGDGTFAGPQSYPTGADSHAAVTGDFNGDGHLDLAVANSTGNTVSVLLGNGDGTFAPQQTYAVGDVPVQLAIGDFNGDGHLDIAVSDDGSDSVDVLLGNGDGTFAAPQSYAAGPNPYGIVAGDFNGDGHLDLAVASASANTVSVLLGNGDGTFDAPISSPATAQAPFPDLAMGDFNGDGHLDLAITDNEANSAVTVLLGNGDGTFGAPQSYAVGSYPFGLVVGDFNNDGHLDLAVANDSSNTVSVLLGNGDGTFTTSQDYGAGPSPLGLGMGDFNGDGRLDLVSTNDGYSTVSVLLNASAPAVSLSPSSLSFGNQSVGTTSAALPVTLTNTGNAGLHLGTLTIGGPNVGDFGLSADQCSGKTVGSNASCTFGVVFTPSQTGLRSASVSIPDDAPGSPQGVSLAGTGIKPALGLKPAKGRQGSASTVMGTGYQPGENVQLIWNCATSPCASGDPVLTTVVADSSGGFSQTVTIPAAQMGRYPIAGVGQTSGAFTTASFQVVPALFITPRKGHAGAQASVQGTGFGPNEQVTVYWNCASTSCTSTTVLAQAQTDGTGNFASLSVTIPIAPGGAYAIGAKGATSHGFGLAHYTVTASLKLKPASGKSGTQTTVTGHGYAANEQVNVYGNCSASPCTSDPPLGYATTDSTGSFILVVTIPTGQTVGAYPVGGVGATSNAFAKATYTVTG